MQKPQSYDRWRRLNVRRPGTVSRSCHCRALMRKKRPGIAPGQMLDLRVASGPDSTLATLAPSLAPICRDYEHDTVKGCLGQPLEEKGRNAEAFLPIAASSASNSSKAMSLNSGRRRSAFRRRSAIFLGGTMSRWRRSEPLRVCCFLIGRRLSASAVEGMGERYCRPTACSVRNFTAPVNQGLRDFARLPQCLCVCLGAPGRPLVVRSYKTYTD